MALRLAVRLRRDATRASRAERIVQAIIGLLGRSGEPRNRAETGTQVFDWLFNQDVYELLLTNRNARPAWPR